MLKRAHLHINPLLCNFIEQEALPKTGISADDFWDNMAHHLKELTPRNKALLAKRVGLQQQLNNFYKERLNQHVTPQAQEDFMRDIGYLIDEGDDFTISTTNVDDEIACIAGPQLVVPVKNERFAVNAANSRYVSLFDALYSTDFLPNKGLPSDNDYVNNRHHDVLNYAFTILDDVFTLTHDISHRDITCYMIDDGDLVAISPQGHVHLKHRDQFIGYNGPTNSPHTIIIRHHGLHVLLYIDSTHPIGKKNNAFIKDIMIESAVTTIQDFEDSVAAVDAEDKVDIYRKWLGLMAGTLEAHYTRDGKQIRRVLAQDIPYKNHQHHDASLMGRSLLFMRHVGHLLTSDMIHDADGNPVGEGIIDAFIGTLCSLHDIQGHGRYRNSHNNSVYIVKPKMHGPEEAAFANDIFAAVEHTLNLAANTLKIGLMDEEKRTTLNLKECIRPLQQRIVFINTGFLDRTGSEIFTDFEAGPMLPKSAFKQTTWFKAYENWNVDIGLKLGFHQRAQIGKGMWAIPNQMAKMMHDKVSELHAGASCAWVPSPPAAALHALHYLYHDVAAIQQQLMARPHETLHNLLTLPVAYDPLTNEQITHELRTNIQAILGYIVRWVDQGIGCSTVPNLDNIGLMEDRATLRISSQIVSNWLYHNICSEDEVRQIFHEISSIVDAQNAHDPSYKPMHGNNNSRALQASLALALNGHKQPDGYTEPLLHHYRILAKHDT